MLTLGFEAVAGKKVFFKFFYFGTYSITVLVYKANDFIQGICGIITEDKKKKKQIKYFHLIMTRHRAH